MNLQELRELAVWHAGYGSLAENNDLIPVLDRILNTENERLGAQLMVPRYELSITGHTAPTITLPSAYHNGVLEVLDVKSRRRLPILTPQEANIELPDRTNLPPGQPKAVEIKPFQPNTLYLWPVPDSTGYDYIIRYARPPAQMIIWSDTAWDGQFPQYHDLIALSAALQLAVQRFGEDARNIETPKNPYGPLNAYRALRELYAQRLEEAKAELLDFGYLYYRHSWRYL